MHDCKDDALCTHAHLSFASKEAAEGCMASKSPPGVAPVPALDGDCCLVHLLNEPSQKGRQKSKPQN